MPIGPGKQQLVCVKLKAIPVVREWATEDHKHAHGVSVTKSDKKVTVEKEEGVGVVVTEEEVKFELNHYEYHM